MSIQDKRMRGVALFCALVIFLWFVLYVSGVLAPALIALHPWLGNPVLIALMPAIVVAVILTIAARKFKTGAEMVMG